MRRWHPRNIWHAKYLFFYKAINVNHLRVYILALEYTDQLGYMKMMKGLGFIKDKRFIHLNFSALRAFIGYKLIIKHTSWFHFQVGYLDLYI